SELFKVSRRVLMSRKAPIFMKKIFDKYVRMETLTSFTASELINKVLKTLAEFKPDIIVLPVFNESHSKTSSSSDEHYGQVLLNVVSYLKSLGLVTILVSEEAYSNSFGKVLELYADVSVKSLPMRRLFRLLILKFTVGGRRIEHQKNLGLRNFISCSRELKTLFRDVLLEDAIQLSSP
ncbi:MAG: hypothetical protein NZ911_06215, partial [Sulfolobales archaeon]|nr:hypothetical protein [Sulfolobales archaeon]